LEQAKSQLQAVLDSFKEKTGFTFEEPKKDNAMEGDQAPANMEMDAGMMEGANNDDMMNEGGDDAMMGMMMEPEVDHYAGDSEDYSGWANFPKLLLREYTVNPYFGDLVKADSIHFEFIAVKAGGFNIPSLNKLNPMALLASGIKPGSLAGAASLLSSCVNYSESDDKEVWFAGFLGEEDLGALKEIAEKKDKLMFPGIISGWDSEEKALKSLDGFDITQSKQKLAKVVYKVKTEVHSAVVCRHFVSRLRANVEKHEEKDGVHHVDLVPQSGELGTVKEWIEKRDNPPTPAPADAGDNNDGMMGGDMMEGAMMGGDMMEGEMMES
jgi:hypothetical protein